MESKPNVIGPEPSNIQVAKPYIFQHQLERSLDAVGTQEANEHVARLQGVAFIDSVRKALQL